MSKETTVDITNALFAPEKPVSNKEEEICDGYGVCCKQCDFRNECFPTPSDK